LLALAACDDQTAPQTAAQQQMAQQEDLNNRAQQEVGIYQPTHWTRKRLANRIGEMLDDPTLATISYAQGIDGKLRCIGRSIGFPLPGATQTTAPNRLATDAETHYRDDVVIPQPEPDQLYYPSEENATWILLVGKNGNTAPAYFEGNVETFLADAKPDPSLIAQDCTE
jgi:hypothetical protein